MFKISKNKINKRLASAVLICTLLGIMLSGCIGEGEKTPAPTTTPTTTTPQPEKIELNVYGVKWKTEWVNEMIDKYYEANHPNVTVTYHGEADLQQKVKTLFVADPEKIDVVMIEAGYHPKWASAGWIIPLNDLPGFDKWKKNLPEEQLKAWSADGKVYGGGAWYTLTWCMFYNKTLLSEVGYDKPPETWDEVIQICLDLKRQKGMEYPIWLQLKTSERRLDWVWQTLSLNLSPYNERPFWSTDWNPIFLEQGSAAREAIQLLHDMIYKYEILSPASFEMDNFNVEDEFLKGNSAFLMNADYGTFKYNNPEKSQIVGQWAMMLFPGSHESWYKTTSWGITSGCKAKGAAYLQAAWEFVQWFGGPEMGKLRRLEWMGGAPWPSVDKDPEVKAHLQDAFGKDGYDIYLEQKEKYLHSQEFFVWPPMFTKFHLEFTEQYVEPNLQKAIMGEISIDKALQNIYDAFLNLTEEYGLPEIK